MKFKLDENLGKQVCEILQMSGYDVTTVSSEQLSGTSDKNLIEICRKEGRCLITLDLEFGNPLIFEPSNYVGIMVLRLPSKPSLKDLLDLVHILIVALGQKDVTGKLWIIQRGRIREYQPEDDNDEV